MELNSKNKKINKINKTDENNKNDITSTYKNIYGKNKGIIELKYKDFMDAEFKIIDYTFEKDKDNLIASRKFTLDITFKSYNHISSSKSI